MKPKPPEAPKIRRKQDYSCSLRLCDGSGTIDIEIVHFDHKQPSLFACKCDKAVAGLKEFLGRERLASDESISEWQQDVFDSYSKPRKDWNK